MYKLHLQSFAKYIKKGKYKCSQAISQTGPTNNSKSTHPDHSKWRVGLLF